MKWYQCGYTAPLCILRFAVCVFRPIPDAPFLCCIEMDAYWHPHIDCLLIDIILIDSFIVELFVFWTGGKHTIVFYQSEWSLCHCGCSSQMWSRPQHSKKCESVFLTLHQVYQGYSNLHILIRWPMERACNLLFPSFLTPFHLHTPLHYWVWSSPTKETTLDICWKCVE